MKNLLVLITICIFVQFVRPQWKWNRFGFRNDHSFDAKPRTRAPIVPYKKAGLEHSLAGPSWSFDKAMTRATGRFEADVMANGIPYSKSGYRGSARLYSLEILESGASFINVMTNGGSGDVDMYVRKDEYPTKRNYDARSATSGNQEQVIIENPSPGRYFIVLYGFNSYESIGFEAEYR